VIDNSEEQIVLRGFGLNQAETLWNQIVSDRHMPERKNTWPGIHNLQQLRDYLRNCDVENSDAEEIGYCLTNRNNDLVGTLHLHTISWAHQKLELGYWLHFEFEGRGYVTTALRLMEAVLKNMGFQKIEIRCDPRNVRSCRVAERNQYIKEGHLRQDKIENGAFRDTFIFGKILRENF
jgi:ribosomal-protein-serine acetyltransferase